MTARRSSLLLVDDADTNIDILSETLAKEYDVRVANDGETALEKVKRNMPDLILLDIMMPGIDGFEVCRRLKADPSTRHIAVIFLTAMNEDSDEAYGLALGAVDYVTKPFNTAILKARVRNHLELKNYRDHLEALVEERTRELAHTNDRLLELGRIKNDFLGMISHELRTPANGMLGIGELIINMCPDSTDCTLYSDLFRESSLRMRNLIEDATMIAEMEKVPKNSRMAISFSALLDEVKASLKTIQIPVVQQGITEPVFLQGDRTLLKRAMETMIILATAFSRDKHKAQITGVVEALTIRVRLALDDLSLTEAQVADFFEIESPIRGASAAQTLGLAPVVADKIIAAFGGKMRLVKEDGNNGCLEAILVREQNHA
jgi:CheY-like chemotaxis protein